MKEIIPYKQQLSDGCLVACFLTLLNYQRNTKYGKKEEQKILIKAINRKNKFYVSGVTKEISKQYKKKIKVFVDNKYFAKILKKEFRSKNIKVIHNKISIRFIKELLKISQVICHIDDNYLGDYSHVSHFIIIEKNKGKKLLVVDPWKGEKLLISPKKLEDSINSLKKHIKMCPLLFTID